LGEDVRLPYYNQDCVKLNPRFPILPSSSSRKRNTGVHQVVACGYLKIKALNGTTMTGTPAIVHFAKVFAMQTRIVGLWNAFLATAPGGKAVPATRRGGIRQK
jgi:hypothetical protein